MKDTDNKSLEGIISSREEKLAFLNQEGTHEISNAEALILAKSSLQTALTGVEVLIDSRATLEECRDIVGACIYREIDRARGLLDDVHGTILTSLKMKSIREGSKDDPSLGADVSYTGQDTGDIF